MKILLLLKYLRKVNDVFALRGKRREDLPDIFTLDKTVESFCMEEIYMKHFREDKSSICFAIRQRCGIFFHGNRR